MKIDFTKEQYEALIKTVYMGSGMVRSAQEGPEGEEGFFTIDEYLYSHAKDFGLEQYVEYDKDENTYYPSQLLEEDEKIINHILRYNDFTFWDQLIFNLAMRDIIKKYGEKTFEKMSEEDIAAKEKPLAEKYEREFEKNGLKNLAIVRNR